MEADLNALTEQWMTNGFSVGSVVKIARKPYELSTSYLTTCPSFTFTMRGRGTLCLDQYTYRLESGVVIHSCSGLSLKAWNTGDEPFECFRVLYWPEARDAQSDRDNYMYKHFELAMRRSCC